MTQVLNSLYFNPSYITARYDVIGLERSETQVQQRYRNFQSNDHKGKVSKQSIRKIQNAVQWLVFLAEDKQVLDPDTGNMVRYKAGVLTLSLPTGNEDLPPQFFRDTLLPSFLASAKYYFGLENYMWKIEAQKRGALHAHLTIDKFLPWRWVQDKWCEILEKHGLLEMYRSKFENMTLSEYIAHRRSTDSARQRNRSISEADYVKDLARAWNKGREQKWSKPNCTDIHSVKKVRSLSAYLCKYMSKDPGFGSGFKGRYWACSHKLSKLRTVRLNLNDIGLLEVCKTFDQAARGYKDLVYFCRSTGEAKFLGAVYFLKRSISEILKVPVIAELVDRVREFYTRSDIDELPAYAYANQKVHIYTPQNP